MLPRSWHASLCVLALIAPELVFGTARAADGAVETPTPAVSVPEPDCDPLDPTRCAVPLKLGQPAPFSGQLLSPNLALDLGQRAELADLRLDLELKRATGLLSAELALERRHREIEQEAFAAQIGLLENRLEDAHQRLWYREPVFVAAVSVVLTVLVLTVSVEALKAL